MQVWVVVETSDYTNNPELDVRYRMRGATPVELSKPLKPSGAEPFPKRMAQRSRSTPTRATPVARAIAEILSSPGFDDFLRNSMNGLEK
jgi:hypothetical protein